MTMLSGHCATDASAYREITRQWHTELLMIKKLIAFARQPSLIPRTAGTSLTWRVVGGIIVDVSKYFTKNTECR